MSEDEKIDWEERYRTEDAPWERGRLHPAFCNWLDAGIFGDGLSVFIPGCGRSPEPLMLARQGLSVTGVDIAESAIAWQLKEFARAGCKGTLVTGSAFEVRGPGAGFDLYYEQTFLCAIDPHDRAAYERAAHEQIAPGGRLLALFMQKEERGGPPYGCDMDEMRALFAPGRWDWPDGDDGFYPHPVREGVGEIAMVLTRRP